MAEDGPELTLRVARHQNGPVLQRRRPRSDAWTADDRRTFLTMLAATCNVTQSARAIGRRPQSAYALRKRNRAFCEAWEDSIADGFDQLELEVLARARFGTPERLPTAAEAEAIERGEIVDIMRKFNDGIALRLLQIHRATRERALERRRRRAEQAGSLAAAAKRMERRLHKMRQRSKQRSAERAAAQAGP